MATAALDLTGILKGIPSGAWVAISEEAQEVIAFSADLQAVLKVATERGVAEPLIVRVPEQSSTLFL